MTKKLSPTQQDVLDILQRESGACIRAYDWNAERVYWLYWKLQSRCIRPATFRALWNAGAIDVLSGDPRTGITYVAAE